MLEVLRGVDLNDFCTPTKLCQSFTTRKTLVGLIPGNTVPGIPGNFPKIFIPGRSREHKTIPGNNGNEN